jgi:hypothetical protein
MGMNEEVLTPEDFAIARANGISYHHAYERFYSYFWDKQRAITEPIRPKEHSLYAKYKDICIVSRKSFNRRIAKGMSPEEAATTPISQRVMNGFKSIKEVANNG